MTFETMIILISLGLLAAMVLAVEAGRRVGMARIARDPDGLARGIGAAEGAIFGLFGLLLAFTFSGAASRFETRRDLITQEANTIGTAWLRLGFLPADAQPPLRDMFRRYLDSRLGSYANAAAEPAAMAKYAESLALQDQIWASATAAVTRPDVPSQIATLMMPALNDMFDIATTRLVAVRNHPPPVVFALLFLMAFVGALLVGYNSAGNKARSVFHSTLYCIVIFMAVYVILDLEYPSLGLVRIDRADILLIDLRKSMD